MFSFKSLPKMPYWEALLVALALTTGMGYTIISLSWLSHISIVTAVSALLAYSLCHGLKHGDIQDGMVGAVGRGMSTIYLFFFIGLMMSALMMSGAIPTLIYYGLGLVSSTYFYFSAFALCSVIDVAIGSSLTTCATVGVMFAGMGATFHADSATTAGAITSGAFFSDKMSPLSDTTGIAASVVGIDLFEHIKNMMYTTIPAWVVSAALMLWLLPSVAASDLSSIDVFRTQLEATGLIHTYSLVPFSLLVVLALMRVSAVVTMPFAITVALAVTYFHNTPGLQQLDAWFYSGYELEGDAFKGVARLTSRDGLKSVLFTQTIVILGISLGGLLLAMGVIPNLLDAVRTFLSNAGRATFGVAATSVDMNFFVGEQCLSILLAGETFRPVYDKLDLYSRNLSHTLEDIGMIVSPLVPQSVCGVFASHTLNVPVWEYLPYAFFYYLCPVLALLFDWTGSTLTKK